MCLSEKGSLTEYQAIVSVACTWSPHLFWVGSKPFSILPLSHSHNLCATYNQLKKHANMCQQWLNGQKQFYRRQTCEQQRFVVINFGPPIALSNIRRGMGTASKVVQHKNKTLKPCIKDAFVQVVRRANEFYYLSSWDIPFTHNRAQGRAAVAALSTCYLLLSLLRGSWPEC